MQPAVTMSWWMQLESAQVAIHEVRVRPEASVWKVDLWYWLHYHLLHHDMMTQQYVMTTVTVASLVSWGTL